MQAACNTIRHVPDHHTGLEHAQPRTVRFLQWRLAVWPRRLRAEQVAAEGVPNPAATGA